MPGGGGGKGNDGSNDMQVSGMEAAVSKEFLESDAIPIVDLSGPTVKSALDVPESVCGLGLVPDPVFDRSL